jgi:hypothetical protein
MVNRLAQQRNEAMAGTMEESNRAHAAAEEFVVEDVVVSDVEGMGFETTTARARAGKESVKHNALSIVQGEVIHSAHATGR